MSERFSISRIKQKWQKKLKMFPRRFATANISTVRGRSRLLFQRLREHNTILEAYTVKKTPQLLYSKKRSPSNLEPLSSTKHRQL